MKLYTQYALVALLAVAPVVAEDNGEQAATTEVTQEESSTQPKTFWDTCYQYRYHIGVGLVAVVGFAYLCYCRTKNVNLPSLNSESQPTPNFPVNSAAVSDKDAHMFAKHVVAGAQSEASQNTQTVDTPTDNLKAVNAPQDTPVTGTNVNADVVATIKTLKHSAVAWLYAKKAELTADWNTVEPMSLEKLAYYAKPLKHQDK